MTTRHIEFTDHSLDSMRKRGVTRTEVEQAIRTTSWNSARSGRYECEKEFDYEAVWNRKFYDKKKVKPVFVEENDKIVVITVFSFYY